MISLGFGEGVGYWKALGGLSQIKTTYTEFTLASPIRNESCLACPSWPRKLR